MIIADVNIIPVQNCRATVEVCICADGICEWVTLFRYYPDEISFTKKELVGLTFHEGLALFTKKDIAYLRS